MADWFGLLALLSPLNLPTPLAPKPSKVQWVRPSVIPIVVRSFQNLPEEMKAHAIGLDAGGKDLFEGPLTCTHLLVVGSESHGVSDDVKVERHSMAAIPGQAESLNASVAGAIAVASIVQQRRTTLMAPSASGTSGEPLFLTTPSRPTPLQWRFSVEAIVNGLRSWFDSSMKWHRHT